MKKITKLTTAILTTMVVGVGLNATPQKLAMATEVTTTPMVKKIDPKMEEVKGIISKRIMNMSKAVNNTKSNDRRNLRGFVLSSQIETFSDVPKKIDQDIKRMKQEIKLLISKIALDIEAHGENKIGSIEVTKDGKVFYITDPNLNKVRNDDIKNFTTSSLKNRVSVRSAYLAIQLLTEVNNEIIIAAQATDNRKEKEELYLRQAIFVYEMADIVSDLLTRITLDGSSALHKLHSEAKIRVETALENVRVRKVEVTGLYEKKLISKKELDREIKSLDMMIQANKASLGVWGKVIKTIGNQASFIEKLKAKLDLVNYKKNKAKLQIETLRDLRGIAVLKDSIGIIYDMVDNIEQLKIMDLDEQTVAILLGGGDSSTASSNKETNQKVHRDVKHIRPMAKRK